MGISIYKTDDISEEIAYLCDDEWDLPSLLPALVQWAARNEGKIASGRYVADIGFSIEDDATGGGGVLTVEEMKVLISLGIDVYFSEYGQFSKQRAENNTPQHEARRNTDE